MNTTQHQVSEFYTGALLKHEIDGNKFTFEFENDVISELFILSDDIFRVRYGIDNILEDDFSYATKFSNGLEIAEMSYEVTDSHFIIRTATMDIEMDKQNSQISVYNKQKEIICADEKGFHWEENDINGGYIVEMSKVIQESEYFYGLGDKPMQLNLRGRRLSNWGKDHYGFQKDSDPLYKNIPFYLGAHSGRAYGIFFDNTFESFFDFGKERRNATSFWAHGGEMNYYFINGPELLDVSARYTQITGVPELPPLWALGYHQCKWSYYPESQVREVTQKLRDLRIPCDAIYFDIDYMDGFRCFTWDLEKFPNPKGLISDLMDQGFKSIAIIDPGIKVDKEYKIFNEALENDYFCRRADGAFMKGKVWPGDCYFPDYTNPKVRKWWADLFEELINEEGIAGVWNDMNEPAIFEVESKTFPMDVRHDYDGHPCSHRKAHNVYGMQMTRATYRGVRKFTKPNNKRPFLITRSCYSGIQRYSSVWTGDNIATWEHLFLANVQIQRLASSGISFAGSDIGGFIDQPTPELFIRWVQFGVFSPFCRVHSSGDHGDQEPWSFGEKALQIVRKFIEIRYRFLPYLYTTFYQYVSKGTQIIRPMAFVQQDDPNALYRNDEFLYGDHLLVCPIQEANSKGRYMYFPKGGWYNYFTDERVEGGEGTWVDADLDTMPLFVREGAVLPHYPLMQYVGEKPITELTLHVYYKSGEERSFLYEDAGDGYENTKGVYTTKNFHLIGKADSLYLSQDRAGHYTPEYETYKFVFHGLPFVPSRVRINGNDSIEPVLPNEQGQYVLMTPKKIFNIEILDK